MGRGGALVLGLGAVVRLEESVLSSWSSSWGPWDSVDWAGVDW